MTMEKLKVIELVYELIFASIISHNICMWIIFTVVYINVMSVQDSLPVRSCSQSSCEKSWHLIKVPVESNNLFHLRVSDVFFYTRTQFIAYFISFPILKE